LLYRGFASTPSLMPVIQGLIDQGVAGDKACFQMPATGYSSVVKAAVIDARWSDLQPVEGGPIVHTPPSTSSATCNPGIHSDENEIDYALRLTAGTGIQLKLRLRAGIDAPQWAKTLDGVTPFQVCDAPSVSNTCGTVGDFWSSDYNSAYATLQSDLAALYDGKINETVMTECATVYPEPFLRQQPTNGTYPGDTVAQDEACFTNMINDQNVWKQTRSGLAFNPYTTNGVPNPAPQPSLTGEAFTEYIMGVCRQVLGSRCVLENFSLRDTSSGNPGPTATYTTMYQKIESYGPPIEFQIADPSNVNNWEGALNFAVGYGASGVEMLHTYYPNYAVSSLTPYYNELVANPTGSTSPQNPSITSVSPNSGSTAGGTSVSIVVANFPTGTPSSVTFGGTAGTNISRSGNTVTVTTPAHAAGAVNVAVTVGSSSATESPGYTYNTPTPQYPDLVIQSLGVSPTSPSIGDDVSFSMVIKNQGAAAVPSGTAIGAAFLIDGSNVTLERGYSSGLAVGATATLTANQAAGSNANSFWVATGGNHTLEGDVNDQATIQESNMNNNTSSEALDVPEPPPPQAPNPPTNITSPSQTSNSINLSWTQSVPGTNGDPDSDLTYHINRDGNLVGSSLEGTPSYIDSGLSPATTYSYTIYATDTSNRASADSSAFTQSTEGLNCAVPPAPGNFKGSANSDGVSVSLSWNAVSAIAPCAIAHYEIEQNSLVIAQATTTSYTVTNLTPATAYSFSVLAVTNDNKAGAASSLNITTATVNSTVPPSAPTNLTGIPVSDSQINLTWTPSSDPSSGIKDYQVERNGTIIATTTVASFGDSNLSPNTSYSYTVIAVNGVNLTTASSTVTVTTLPTPTSPGSTGGTSSGGSSTSGSSIPLLQNTTSVGSGVESNNAMGGSDQTYNQTGSHPVSDNPSANQTTPGSKSQVVTASLASRLTAGVSGAILVIAGLLFNLLLVRRKLLFGQIQPDLNAVMTDDGTTRLTAGTIIKPNDRSDDHE
jgi:IPT/TIG domain-containing protein/fibronectin type III domain protein/CARDB protein